jgi:hypothetical protein
LQVHDLPGEDLGDREADDVSCRGHIDDDATHHRLLARRSINDPSEIAYRVCYGPRRATLIDLAWVAWACVRGLLRLVDSRYPPTAATAGGRRRPRWLGASRCAPAVTPVEKALEAAAAKGSRR